MVDRTVKDRYTPRKSNHTGKRIGLMSLMKRFYTDRYLHIRSFSIDFCVSATLCYLLYQFRTPEFYQFAFSPWHLAMIPLGIYIGGVSAVFIHNATHNSFPNRRLNEICGYIAGVHQLWGFMGWKLIHLVHHHYSDNPDMDPHPPRNLTFWQFGRTMFLHSSAKITERYREHWGAGIKTQLLHKSVLIIFIGLTVLNTLFWFLLFGPSLFVFFYIPSYIANHLLFIDINYSAHPRNPATGETQAANLDHTLYHKLANAMWSGIYYHANHHRKPLLYNPKKMQVSQRSSSRDDLDLAA
jgi:fatty acid desaturase